MTAPQPPTPSPWPDDDDVDTSTIDLDSELEELLADDWDGKPVDAEVLSADPPTPITVARRPMLPGSLRHPKTVGWSSVKWWAQSTDTWFHLVRVPTKYWAILALSSIVTAHRLIGWTTRFVWHNDSREDLLLARMGATENQGRGVNTVFAARKTRRFNLAFRAGSVVLALLAGWAFAVAPFLALTGPWRALVAYVVLPVVGWPSRPTRDEDGDGGLLSRRTRHHHQERITASILVAALSEIGVPRLTAQIKEHGDRAVGFLTEVHRDGEGWAVRMSLPRVPARDVLAKRVELAAALGRPTSCVWPELVPNESANWLDLFVSDKPMSVGEPVPWPLAKAGSVNFFDGFPVGQTQRGRWITMNFHEQCVVIGALPGMGKTQLSILLTAGHALDPRVELHIWNCKGDPAYKPFIPIAHSYGSSADMAKLAPYLLADLRDVNRRMALRYEAQNDIDGDATLNDALASRRDLDFHPILFVIGETHRAFTVPEFGPQIAAEVEELVRLGRALGMPAVLDTQRPDRKSVPTPIRDNITTAFAGRVKTQVANDMILGDGYYSAGYRATDFSRADRGVFILAGEEEEPVVMRAAYLGPEELANVAARALAARTAAGRITGMAAGQEITPADEVSTTILEDLSAVWPLFEQKQAGYILAERLAEHDSGRYLGWTGEQVTKAVKPFGMVARSVWVPELKASRQGYDRDELIDAYNTYVAALDDEDPAGPPPGWEGPVDVAGEAA